MELKKKLSPLFDLTTRIQDPQIKASFIELFNIIEEYKRFQKNHTRLRKKDGLHALLKTTKCGRSNSYDTNIIVILYN